MKKFRKSRKRIERRFFIVLASLLPFYECLLLAQSTSAVSAINEATSEIKSYYDPVKKLMWALAAIFGLIGAVKVYYKIQGKDQESSKHATSFVLGAVALLAGEVFIRKTFIE